MDDDYEFMTEKDQIWIDFDNKNWNSPMLIQYELNPDGIEKELLPVFLFVSVYSNKPIWFAKVASRLGIEVPSMDDFELSPVHVSIRLNHNQLFLYFLSKYNIDVQDKNGATPLHLALKLNRTDMVQYLVAKNASKEAVDRKRRTTLNYAVMSNNVKLVKQFLNFYNPEQNPMVEAIPNSSFEIINLLAKTYPKTLQGSIKLAIQERNASLVAFFVELGVNPTEEDYHEELLQFRMKNDEKIHDQIISSII